MTLASHAEHILPGTPRAAAAPRAPAGLALAAALLFACPSLPACASEPRAPRVPRAAAATPTALAPRPWEHERSDLPVNPRVRFGALPSGLRWAWMDNPEPRGRTELRLHVDVGSLAETDDERGMAHVLEHMAFNGSRHFAPGTLVEWFQKHGMAFGADTNASTDFSATVYRLDLPRSDAATLDEGLTMLRDVADGLLLLPEEVEAELGVINGEERERDSAGFRAWLAEMADRFDGTRIPARVPIGVREVRARFDAPALRAFYERWYHPQAMTLILVGDLQGLDPRPLIEERFGGLAVRAEPAPPEPPRGTPRLDGPAGFAHHAPELPLVTLTAGRLVPFVEEPLTRETVLRDLPLLVSRRMLNLRLRERSREADSPFLEAAVQDADAFRVLDGEELVVVCEPARWREALAAAEQELRRALEHGFRGPELEALRRDWLRSLDEAVQRQATRASGAYADELQASAESPFICTTAETDLALYGPALESLTPEPCRAAFARAWATGVLRLSAVGGLDLGPRPLREGRPTHEAPELLAAWEASARVPVEPPAELADGDFAYAAPDGAPGAIAERERIDDLEVERVRFANGARLMVKRTDFQERQILVTARFGHGQHALAPERAAVGWMAGRAFDLFGLGEHDVDALRRLHAGRQVGLRFSLQGEACALTGGTSEEDLPRQLELLCAALQHPGWRPEGLRQVRDQIGPIFSALAKQVLGPVQTGFLPALHGGDPRFGLPPREELLGVTLEDVRAWLEPQLAGGPLDVAIVGDVDVEAAVDAAARTIGRLAARPPIDGPRHDRVRLAAALRQEASVETEVPGSLVLVVHPTQDGRVARERRRLTLLGLVLSDRLRVHVREALGASYSPGARSDASRSFQGLGMIMVQAAAEPGREAELLETCLGVSDALATEGVAEEELERQREPLLAQLAEQVRTNGFWLGLLADASREPALLDEARAIESDYREVTAAELTELARRHLRREDAGWIVSRAVPPGAGVPDDGAAAQER